MAITHICFGCWTPLSNPGFDSLCQRCAEKVEKGDLELKHTIEKTRNEYVKTLTLFSLRLMTC